MKTEVKMLFWGRECVKRRPETRVFHSTFFGILRTLDTLLRPFGSAILSPRCIGIWGGTESEVA